MKHYFEAFQFLSRKTIEKADWGTLRSSPRQREDIHFEMQVRIERKPFELTFAQLKAQRPSIGASQYIDPDLDGFLSRRWPICISACGEVELSEESLDADFRRRLLRYPRSLLWACPAEQMKAALPIDQRALLPGYRREYFTHQSFDISGERRPSTQAIYASTEPNEPTGPGVVTFPRWGAIRHVNEFVWSPILPFRNQTNFGTDKPAIQRALDALQKHYNSYNEFTDAERYVRENDVKAAVRSAASSVDALIRYYQEVWGLSRPPGHLPFDEKIDNILRRAGRPMYGSVNPSGSGELLDLYRCRNSMHEGDCYYTDKNGIRVDVRRIDQVSSWVKTVEEFTVWIDSLA